MKRIVETALWWALIVLAAANGIFAMRYLLPHVPLAAQLPNLKLHRFALSVHASIAGIALLIGPLQIAEGPRLRWPGWHRILGWVYVVAVAIAAVAALVLVPQTAFGPIAGSGFFVLATLWLIATGIALRKAIQHRFQDHRRWMLRSYAFTAAAITLRILLPASAMMGLPAGPSYRAIAWLCWLINLGLVEIYLLNRPQLTHSFQGVTSKRDLRELS